MAKFKHLYFFVGTTAELIKLSPVIRELKVRKIPFKIIASNQNTLSFNELKELTGGVKKADYTFLMKKFTNIKNVYLRFIWWMIKSFGNYLLFFNREFRDKRKDGVLFIIHGDTITSLIGSLIAKITRVKLVHVESGLRSFNFLEPFPEEISRFVISWLTSVHFCPNAWSVDNLNFHPGKKINTFANTIAESTQNALKLKQKPKLGFKKGQKYFVLVLHRQEHTLFSQQATRKIVEYFVSVTNKNLKCVFIMHHLTKDYLNKHNDLQRKITKNENVILPERFGYAQFVKLVADSEFIATDGGSNQEEAYYLGKPCLILRQSVERIEGLKKNAVIGGNLKTIDSFVKNYAKYKRAKPKLVKMPSEIIVNYLVDGSNKKS